MDEFGRAYRVAEKAAESIEELGSALEGYRWIDRNLGSSNGTSVWYCEAKKDECDSREDYLNSVWGQFNICGIYSASDGEAKVVIHKECWIQVFASDNSGSDFIPIQNDDACRYLVEGFLTFAHNYGKLSEGVDGDEDWTGMTLVYGGTSTRL